MLGMPQAKHTLIGPLVTSTEHKVPSPSGVASRELLGSQGSRDAEFHSIVFMQVGLLSSQVFLFVFLTLQKVNLFT